MQCSQVKLVDASQNPVKLGKMEWNLEENGKFQSDPTKPSITR